MRTYLRTIAALALAAGWTVLPALPAGASELTGCTGTAVSYDADGKVIDSAEAKGGKLIDTTGGGDAFTKSNPFLIDNEGTVVYSGASDDAIVDHDWFVEMLGVKVLSGADDNVDRTQQSDGEVSLADDLPFAFTGLVQVSGEIQGAGGAGCAGDGYVEVQGAPFANPVVWAGVVFSGVGALLLVLSMPRAVPSGGGVR